MAHPEVNDIGLLILQYTGTTNLLNLCSILQELSNNQILLSQSVGNLPTNSKETSETIGNKNKITIKTHLRHKNPKLKILLVII